jgi:polar amino acid transport system substrate-binding protein
MRALLLSLAIIFSTFPAFAKQEGESVYDRVMRTQTIRCGYGTSVPWLFRDAKTGKMQGLYFDIMEEVAKQLSLKLDWPEETGWANMTTSLLTKRVDVACSMLWLDPQRGKQVAYTRPLFYTALHAFTRADETRFTGKAEEINNAGVRIIVDEGDIGYKLAKKKFPAAQLVSLPATASVAEYFMNVTTNKADIIIIDSVSAADYSRSQNIKLKRIPLSEPLVGYGTALAVGIHETEMKEMLDTTVSYLQDTGILEEIVEKFQKEYPDAILMPQKSR